MEALTRNEILDELKKLGIAPSEIDDFLKEYMQYFNIDLLEE